MATLMLVSPYQELSASVQAWKAGQTFATSDKAIRASVRENLSNWDKVIIFTADMRRSFAYIAHRLVIS